ncbi:MAG: transglycosylase domain-containing protein [bacterium]|nr:transglycosylase domain-containing protein [bacterium]MDZ4284763.1 transglycosylase domain-containing protein [Patescibacteria group bacterium]
MNVLFQRALQRLRTTKLYTVCACGACAVIIVTFVLAGNLRARYQKLESPRILDRAGVLIKLSPNESGYYMQPIETPPENFRQLLLKKEDRLFYYHVGANPASIARDALALVHSGKRYGSSTLTQQLVKVLLKTENKRTLMHKALEALYALSLELWSSKKTILAMYVNSAYFGNQAQGVEEASRYYFGRAAAALSSEEAATLVAAIGKPSIRYPGTIENERAAATLLARAGKTFTTKNGESARSPRLPLKQERAYERDTAFEASAFGARCTKLCTLTLEGALTERLRALLREHLLSSQFEGAKNGAIVVIKLPENELLAIVGSPYPRAAIPGAQINMALEPRPIGSTAKPLFYLKALEKGARPYTLVEDREYKYEIGTGFEFYPKNYDGRYRGDVTLHAALSESLNVPSVKVLEYVGLPLFYDFLTETLRFKPLQPLESYSLGIALGGLEMDLLTLSHYYTLFAHSGILKPLIISRDTDDNKLVSITTPPMEREFVQEKRVADTPYVALLNRILSDRATGVEQFGIKSFLNLPTEHYALKTGTSRDYHDSWTIGYTPDFLVGVWIGNHDNTPMPHVSGQSGAGRIWHDAMEIMLTSAYNRNTSFDFDGLQEFRSTDEGVAYGLPGDNYEETRMLLLRDDATFITHPHDRDVLLFEPGMTVPLEAREAVEWRVNGVYIGNGRAFPWTPIAPGTYTISATSASVTETIYITIMLE